MELCCQENWKRDCSKLSCYMDTRDEIVSISFSAFDPLIDIYIDTFSFSRRDDKLAEFVKSLNLKNFCYYGIAYRLARIKCPTNSKYPDFLTHLCFIMSYLNWSYGNPLNKDNYLKKQLEMNTKMKYPKKINKVRNFKKKYIEYIVKGRVGQQRFRKDLIDYYGCCQLCGIKKHEILVASHSKPFEKCNNKEAVNFYNWLLFCRNDDKLYNDGYISFDNDGNLLISCEMDDIDIQQFNLKNVKKLELEPEHKEFIKWHRNNIFRK